MPRVPRVPKERSVPRVSWVPVLGISPNGRQSRFRRKSGPCSMRFETFNALKQRQQAEVAASTTSSGELRGRVNLLNWDGNGMPPGLFPTRQSEEATGAEPGRPDQQPEEAAP